MSTLKEPDLPMPMPLSQRLLAAAVVVAALYFGRELLIPLALATLLAFVLAPLNARIRRFGLPRAVAVTAVVAITLGALVGSSVFMAGQVRMLGKELPTYQNNIAEKFDRLRAQLRAPGVFTEASKVIDAVESEIAQTQGPFDGRSAAAARRPSRVELVPTPPGANPPCSMADLIRIDSIGQNGDATIAAESAKRARPEFKGVFDPVGPGEIRCQTPKPPNSIAWSCPTISAPMG